MSFVRILMMVALVAVSNFVSASATPWIDFRIVDGFVVVPTVVAGIEGHSVIDTGAQFTGIAQDFVERNQLDLLRGEPKKIIGVNKGAVRKTYRNVPVTLMGAELTFASVVDLDLGARPQLLIGADFLRTLYFQFDYPNKRLRAISRDVFDLKKLSNVPSRLDPGNFQPIAKVRLNDEKDIWLTIDTGNAGGVFVKRSVAKKEKWLEVFPTEKYEGRGIVALSEHESFRLPILSIGPYNVRNARVATPAEGARAAMFKRSYRPDLRRSKSQGLLGYDVLKNFVVTFDYRTGAIFVELPEDSEQD